jgi:hypothetical protein
VVLDVKESRPDFQPGTVTITPTYFNFLRDPEYNDVATPERPVVCVTEADGCYKNIWLGLAPAPPSTVTVSGTTTPAPVAPQTAVIPATWDLRWDTLGSTGTVEIRLGNLTGGFTVSQIVAAQVRLNGTVLPTSTGILASAPGFTGPVLKLTYPQAAAMASLKALAAQHLVAGQTVPLLVTGLLTTNGQAGSSTVATLRATPSVTVFSSGAATLIDALIAKVQGMGFSAKLTNDLVGKLTDAKSKIAINKITDACIKLNDFINSVNAQKPTVITPAQKADLIADATFIKRLLGCP